MQNSPLVAGFRNRANQTIGFSYDALGRPTLKDLPGTEPDVSYGYDLLGRTTSASHSGNSLSFSYDALGRNLSQAGPQGTASSQYDLAGRRTRLTYPGSGLYLTAALGPGPRDGIMTGLHARFGWPLAVVRTCIELTAVTTGFLLGGTAGIGSLLFAVLIGPAVGLAVGRIGPHAAPARVERGEAR